MTKVTITHQTEGTFVKSLIITLALTLGIYDQDYDRAIQSMNESELNDEYNYLMGAL